MLQSLMTKMEQGKLETFATSLIFQSNKGVYVVMSMFYLLFLALLRMQKLICITAVIADVIVVQTFMNLFVWMEWSTSVPVMLVAYLTQIIRYNFLCRHLYCQEVCVVLHL